MGFNNNEKAAIVCLLIEVINADNNIDPEELYVLNNINSELGVNQEVFESGKNMDCNYAITVVKHMSEDKKMQVATLMTKVIDADGVVDNKELALLNKICELTGIDLIVNRQPE